MAHDPNVADALNANTDAALSTLNRRSVVVRDRFELDLIQIYNRQGEARTNLLLSSLYHQSSLLDLVGADALTVRGVDDHLLLLSRVSLPDGRGTIITGIDLGTELHRIVNRDNLGADLALKMDGLQAGTIKEPAAELAAQPTGDRYTRQVTLSLGESDMMLVVTYRTTDITRVTSAGLLIMIGSTVITTVLLLGVSVVVTRSITRPVHRLAEAAQGLAKGDLSQKVEVVTLPQPFGIGDQDEIGLLTQAFNKMVIELRDLYQDLEGKVEARTKQLTAAADVARAASASLNLDIVLQTSVELICERFGFYHASVFIIEPGSSVAVLRESTSEAGRILKARQHQLTVGSRSLVGAATATRQPRIVQDVLADPTHFKNPLLPETRAEAVIPLLSGETVIGALDVQSTEVNAFLPDLVDLLSTLADQIAVAVQHARLYERQKETAEHLAEVDHLKTEFLTVMSHELRTPLNSIIGFARVILKGIDGPLTELQKSDLTSIYNNGQHLLGLINNILDFSKLEAGKMELCFEAVDVRAKIEKVLSTATGLIKDKAITLKSQLSDDSFVVCADSTRVEQVLLNLVSNAVKFTETGQVTVAAYRNHHHVVVSVADTGLGIPPDKLSEIFKEFTQVDSSNTRRFSGTGLGLPIAKKLVEMHGGEIWAESKVDQGSVFSFSLPIEQAADKSPEPALDNPTEPSHSLKELPYESQIPT
jgi:signal transduction histidine kinase